VLGNRTAVRSCLQLSHVAFWPATCFVELDNAVIIGRRRWKTRQDHPHKLLVSCMKHLHLLIDLSECCSDGQSIKGDRCAAMSRQDKGFRGKREELVQTVVERR